MTRAMVWKVFREGLRYALLGLALMAAGIGYAFWQSQTGRSARGTPGIVSQEFQTLTVVGCPVIGFAIGLLVILPESRRDRWAFLAHRPMSRSSIFIAKLAGALALYCLATGFPLAAAIAYAARPGSFAFPFVPTMTLAPLADWSCG